MIVLSCLEAHNTIRKYYGKMGVTKKISKYEAMRQHSN